MRKSVYAVLAATVLLSACVTKPIATLQAIDPMIRNAMTIESTVVRYDAALNAQEGLNENQLSYVIERELAAQIAQSSDPTRARKVTFDVEILAYREPNAALAIIVGDTSQIVGNVKVLDFESGSVLGNYYIEVIEGAGGVLGLATADINENGLGREFVEQFVRHFNEDAPR